MKKNILLRFLLVGVVSSVGALAEMTVDKSGGLLTVTSTMSGTVIAKVIGPNDEVVVDRKYAGNSFTWAPSGVDGAYRYDVRVVPIAEKTASASTNDIQAMEKETLSAKSDYAGGTVEVANGQMTTEEKE